jgi:3-oxoacyl-[acyl-carrier-protein] synthase III
MGLKMNSHKTIVPGTRLSITGIGMAVPDRVVPNSELGELLGVTPEWIVTRTGVLERRYAAATESSASLGTRAAFRALEVSELDPEELSMVVVATCTPDHRLPATACFIQEAIGATNAAAFDIGAACSGFIYGLGVSTGLMSAGIAEKILLVGTDVLSRYVDFKDPLTAPLFGDGAGAVILEADDSAEPIQLVLGADGSGAQQVIIPGGGSRLPASGSPLDPELNLLKMQGRKVFTNAVRILSDLGAIFGTDSFDLLIAHQANRRILDECAVQLGIDPEKVFMNIQHYGNTSSASIPMALAEAWEKGRVSEGDALLMLAFGAGFTWGGARLRWTLPSNRPRNSLEEPTPARSQLAHAQA